MARRRIQGTSGWQRQAAHRGVASRFDGWPRGIFVLRALRFDVIELSSFAIIDLTMTIILRVQLVPSAFSLQKHTALSQSRDCDGTHLCLWTDSCCYICRFRQPAC
jgi:hypothetical protein